MTDNEWKVYKRKVDQMEREEARRKAEVARFLNDPVGETWELAEDVFDLVFGPF
jgi:hypothetical protein